MNCDFCDTAVVPDANFCNRCGNAISELRSEQSSRLAIDGPDGSARSKSGSFIGSMMRSGLAARVVFSTVAYGLLGLWEGSILPMVDATTLGTLGAAYGALRKI